MIVDIDRVWVWLNSAKRHISKNGGIYSSKWIALNSDFQTIENIARYKAIKISIAR